MNKPLAVKMEASMVKLKSVYPSGLEKIRTYVIANVLIEN